MNTKETTILNTPKEYLSRTKFIAEELALSIKLNCDISIEIAYVSHLNADCEGLFIQEFNAKDKLESHGTFIAFTKEGYQVYSPKYDSGDDSVGLPEYYVNSFDEGFAPDLITKDLVQCLILALTMPSEHKLALQSKELPTV